MELLTEDGIRQTERTRSYEYGLPEYLQHDLDAYKDGLKNGSDIMDCLWGELYGSINAAEISDGIITPEHAAYLRKWQMKLIFQIVVLYSVEHITVQMERKLQSNIMGSGIC